jgi:5-methylcytosine-specific restriction enzyme subunit McrC
MSDMKVSESTFGRIIYNRKTLIYKKSIDIARLLLLHYHPDVSRGKDHVLALMFDMNYLWEQFVYVSLRKHKEPITTISAQTSKLFWKPKTGYRSKIIPDIVINKDKENCVVLDTKWKNLKGTNPSPDDLRQMFVYHEYYNAQRVALVYPGSINDSRSGKFFDPKTSKESDKECSIISLSVETEIRQWQKNIHTEFQNWMRAKKD